MYIESLWLPMPMLNPFRRERDLRVRIYHIMPEASDLSTAFCGMKNVSPKRAPLDR